MTRNTDEEVLLEFAVEPRHDADVLNRYIQAYPHLQDELLSVLHEIELQKTLGPGNVEVVEEDVVAAAWTRFSKCTPARPQAATGSALDAKLRGTGLRAVARAAGIPRVIMLAVQERCILAASYPAVFLQRLATAAGVGLDEVRAFVALPPIISGKPAFSAEGKPGVDLQKPFEAVVLESGLTEDERANLLGNTG
ncbi:hypothetical protein J8J14_21060 [Roseomonas sp. SSH11]|uniref:XRE family transcriptional regulator n=1 Tax=Pararoseomonas baculiformis TaxID=2820812 RepID=A0ABS4AK58_9PROT|nr:hypothetical protein [Pararoseomonas baculiformis]MBP0447266.1 hypothetical protein [Pararoseomonas baculiformis]